jgi:hypothetical protein
MKPAQATRRPVRWAPDDGGKRTAFRAHLTGLALDNSASDHNDREFGGLDLILVSVQLIRPQWHIARVRVD